MPNDDFDFIPQNDFGALSGPLLGPDEELQRSTLFNPVPLAAPSQPEPFDEFERGAELAREEASSGQLSSVIEEDKKLSLDTLSENEQIAKELKIPLELVEANPEDARLERDNHRAREILKLTPKLKAMVTDPDKGKGLSSSIAGMSAFELMVDDWEVGFTQGERIVEMGQAAYKSATEGDPKLAFKYLMDAREVKRQMHESRETESIFGGVGIVGSVAEQIGLMSEMLPKVLALGAVGAVEGAVLSPFLAPISATVGFGAGAGFGVFSETGKIEGGAQYLDLLDEGVDPETARYIASGVGVINGALEVVGVGGITKPIAASAKKVINDMFVREAKKMFKDKTKGQALRNTLRSYGKATGGELAVEASQEVVNIGGSELGRGLTDGLTPKSFSEEGRSELGNQILSVLEKTIKSVPFITAPGGFATAYTEFKDIRTAENSATLMRGLGDHAASEFAQKLPAQFREVVADATKDGPLENVYIDTKQFQEYYQDDVEAVVDEMGIRKEYDSALASPNGFVKVPIGTYAETIAKDPQANNAMLEHSKFKPLGITPAEANILKTKGTQLEKDAEKTLEARIQDDQFTESAQVVHTAIKEELVRAGRFTEAQADRMAALHRAFAITQGAKEGVQPHEIYERFGLKVDSVKNPQSITREQFDSGAIPSFAALQGTEFDGVRVEPQGNRPGFTISMRRLQEAGAAQEAVDLDQQAAAIKRTPEFQEKFKDTKVVDENGEPLVVYHGTQADEDFGVFNTEADFDLGAHFGTAEQANDRLGTLADWRREEPLSKMKSAIGMDAKENRESRIVPVYLSIKNPLRMNDAGDFSDPSQVLQAIQEAAIPYEAYKAIKDVVDKGQNIKAVKNKMEELGYDGVVYQNQAEGPGDSYIAFHPEQIKSIFNERPTEAPGILNQEINLDDVEVAGDISENFAKWAGGPDVRVLSPGEINSTVLAEGVPVVFRVYHGTTNDFNVFKTIKSNIEGHFGKVNYFTSSFDDAQRNYGKEGADLTARIDLRAQELRNEMDVDNVEFLTEEFDVSVQEAEAIADGDPVTIEDVAARLAKEELDGGQEQVMELFVRMENPFVVGTQSPWMEFVDNDKIRSEALEVVADDEGITIKELEEREEEFEDRIDEARWDIESQSDHVMVDAINAVASRHGIDASSLASEIYELGEGASQQDIEQLMRGNKDLQYAEDFDTGSLMQSQFISEVIEELGYDGIVLNDADQQFKLNIEPDTAHIHIFDAKKTNIKSVDNIGSFDRENENIYLQSAAPLQKKPLKIKGTGPGGKVTNWDVGETMTDRHMKEHGRVLDPKNSEEDYKLVLKELNKEYKNQAKELDSGHDWYIEDINEAVEVTKLIIPELADPTNKDIFLAITALMSPQQRPGPNWDLAVDAMQAYIADGKIPEKRPNGKNFGVNALRTGTQLVQKLIDSLGTEGALKWLMTKKSGREMAQFRMDSGLFVPGRKIADYLSPETKLSGEYYGIAMMGPKVSEFFANVTGFDQDAVTVDLWAARTYNRHIGRLLDVSPQKVEDKEIVSDVRGKGERDLIKRLFRDLAKKNNVDPSAMQAALWYFEQRLFRNHGVSTKSENFSGAAVTAAEKRSITVPRAGENAGRAVENASSQLQELQAEELNQSEINRVTPSWYYSQLSESFHNLPDNKTQDQSAKGWIQIFKKLNAKPAEKEWTGIFEWLETKTKENQVLELEDALADSEAALARMADGKHEGIYPGTTQNREDRVARITALLAKEKAGKGPKITKSEISNWLFNNGVEIEVVEIDSRINSSTFMSDQEYNERVMDILDFMLAREVDAKIDMLVQDEIFKNVSGAQVRLGLDEPIEVTRKRVEDKHREAIEAEVNDLDSATNERIRDRAIYQANQERFEYDERNDIDEIGTDLTPYTFKGGTDESSLLLKFNQKHPGSRVKRIVATKLFQHGSEVYGGFSGKLKRFFKPHSILNDDGMTVLLPAKYNKWADYINDKDVNSLPGHDKARSLFTAAEEKVFDDNVREIAEGDRLADDLDFSSHVFPEHQNIVVWIRKQTREENGKRILFIDEVQTGLEVENPEGRTPFTDSKSAYTTLAMKKIITYAVENGFDRVEWTTGSQQSERYPHLKDTVDEVRWNPSSERLHVIKKGETVPTFVGVYDEKKLVPLIGKGATEQLLAQPLIPNDRRNPGDHLLGTKPESRFRKLETADLEVSGKGMVEFYDVLMPNVASKAIKSLTGEKVEIAYGDPAPDAYDGPQQPGFDVGPIRDAFGEDQVRMALFQKKKAGDNRAAINFNGDVAVGDNFITLFENADLSSFLHESGHFFFEAMRHMASQPGANEQTKKDMMTLLREVGVPDLETWNKMTMDQRRVGHERVAEAFESYLFSGQAPTVELADLFHSFKEWLSRVYDSIKSIGSIPSEDISSVFDRMLATQEEIESTRRQQGSMPMFDTYQEDLFTPDEWEAYRQHIIGGDTEAYEELDTKTLRAMRWVHGARGRVLSQMQREHREQRKAVKEEITKEVADKPIYRAITWLRQPIVKRAKIKGSRKDVVPQLDSLHTAIAKLGGLDKAELVASWGMDPQTKFKTFKSVARKEEGLDIDSMAELLAQQGYLTVDSNGKWDLHEFEEKFFDEISDRKHYSDKNDQHEASESYEDEWFAAQLEGSDEIINPDNIPHAKISIESLERLYSGEEKIYESLPTGRWGVIGEEGLDVDIVAQMFGFTSGDQMIRTMVDSPNMKQAIEAGTDAQMTELFSEMATQEQREKAATLAVRNEARTRLVHAELSALTKGVGDKNILAASARKLAAEKIATLRVEDIVPGKYIAAEKRANRMAEIAIGKGNRAEAIERKREAILHYHFAKAAANALEEVERGVKYTNRLDTKAARKAIPSDYTDQIDQLLEPYDLRKSVTKKDRAQRLAMSEWIAKQEEMGFSPVIDERLLRESELTHYKEMTLEEFRGLIDSVKNIEHLGRIEGKILLDEQRRDLNQVVGELVSSLGVHRMDQKKPPREPRLYWNKVKGATNSVFAAHKKFSNIIRWFDGFKDGGIAAQILLKPLNDRTNWAANERAKATQALSEIFKVFDFKERSKLYLPVFIEELGESLSKAAMIAVALNWGNATNRQRIMGGEGWTHVQIQGILDKLSKKEMDFVQNIWDYNDTFWEAISAKEKRLTGVSPEKVEALPVYTKHGTYRGGYHAIKFDSKRSNEAFKHQIAAAEKSTKLGAFGRGMTKRDHVKQRVEGEVKIPMRLDLDVIFEHVTEVIQDLAFHEYLIDAGRIIDHPDFHETVLAKYNDAIYDQLRKTTADVALGEVPTEGIMNQFFGYIRQGSTISSLGMNLGTVLLQPIGLTQSMVRIGPKWVLRGFYRWIRGPEEMQSTMDFILERSLFMLGRKDNINREVNELRGKVSRAGAVSEIKGMMGDHYFTLIAKAQLIADVPTWLGMYEKAMEEGVDGVQVDEEMAIFMADQAVKDAQGAGDIMDRSAVQKGSEAYKMFTNFYSFFNVLYNLTADSVHRTNPRSLRSIGELAVDMMLLYWIPATMSFMLREAMIRGECDHGRDLECVFEKSITETGSYLLGTMVGLREVGGAIGGAFGYSGPAGSRFFGAASKLVKQVQQGESDEALWKAAGETMGILFHLPGVQAERTIRAIANGDWSRLFGKPKGDE